MGVSSLRHGLGIIERFVRALSFPLCFIYFDHDLIQWASVSGTPTRLPSRGPHIPVSDLTFMMITADNYVHIVCNRQYKQDLVFMKRSLSINGASYEPLSMIVGDNFQPSRQCVDAALGLGYTGQFIVEVMNILPKW